MGVCGALLDGVTVSVGRYTVSAVVAWLPALSEMVRVWLPVVVAAGMVTCSEFTEPLASVLTAGGLVTAVVPSTFAVMAELLARPFAFTVITAPGLTLAALM